MYSHGRSAEQPPRRTLGWRTATVILPEVTAFFLREQAAHGCFVTLGLFFRSSPFHRPEFSRGQSATAADTAHLALLGTGIHERSITSNVPAALAAPATADPTA